ncbi:MAG: glycine cleavage system protein 2, mitochondrial [Phycisphaerales bacterium]|nr:glycine cleavage system protein 2, mitochondrial [Phycisphaerales bacterium]
MSAPTDRKYLETHEWHKVEGDTATIGITQIAADELTDITYVSLPKVGAKVSANKPFGEIESVKATSDLYSGVSGEVVAINDGLNNDPGLVNRDPFNGGWMVKVKLSSPADVDRLLSAPDYLKKTGHE